jgi:hypothetical protein
MTMGLVCNANVLPHCLLFPIHAQKSHARCHLNIHQQALTREYTSTIMGPFHHVSREGDSPEIRQITQD